MKNDFVFVQKISKPIVTNSRPVISGTEIIVAGGIVHSDDDGSYYTGKTEVYSLSTGKWRAGEIHFDIH